MTVTALVERPATARFSSVQLLEAFAKYKAMYGADVGLMLVAMNLELQEQLSELEARIVELEQQRRKR